MKTSKHTKKFSLSFPHDYIPKLFEDIEKRHRRREQESSWSSGNRAVDRLFGGFHPGDLIVLAGYTGNLKSSFLIQLLVHANVYVKKSFLSFSSTFAPRQYFQRLLASAAQLPIARIAGGMIRDDDWPKLTRGVGSLISHPYFFQETEGSSYKELAGEGLKEFIQTRSIDILAVDPLQLSIDPTLADLQKLKQLAMECSITVFAVVDLLPEPGRFGPIQFNDLQLSAELENLVDGFCFLHKEKFITEDCLQPVEALVLQNFAMTHRTIFDYERHRFIDPEETDYGNP